jgi:integrase
MPKINLKQAFVDNPPKPTDKPKADYFDTQLTGLLLEVRRSGKATYYLRYRDKYGRIKQARIGKPETISLEDVRVKAKALKSQALIGFDPVAEHEKLKAIPTFKEFVYEQYVPFIKSYKRSWQADLKMIENRMIRLWGQKRMNEIATQDLVNFQNGLVQGGFKPASANRYMALVKYIFNLAERWDVIDKAPSRNTKRLADPVKRDRFLTDEELYRLLDALDNCRSKVVADIIRLLLLTGARRSEVSGLRWEELDLERGFWTLPAERNKTKKEKIIPLSEESLELLKSREGCNPEFVFPNPETGKPIQFFHRTWDRIRKAAGIPDVKIHTLRHSVASWLINSGRSLYEVKELLGHADISTTQRYAHLTQDTLKDATEIVGHRVGEWKVKNGQ